MEWIDIDAQGLNHTMPSNFHAAIHPHPVTKWSNTARLRNRHLGAFLQVRAGGTAWQILIGRNLRGHFPDGHRTGRHTTCPHLCAPPSPETGDSRPSFFQMRHAGACGRPTSGGGTHLRLLMARSLRKSSDVWGPDPTGPHYQPGPVFAGQPTCERTHGTAA